MSMSQSPSTPSPPADCAVCAEPTVTQRPCCHVHSCQECLYRHIRAIFEDTATGTMRGLVCPMGCGKALEDNEIRACFRRHHRSVIQYVYRFFVFIFSWLRQRLVGDRTLDSHALWTLCQRTRHEVVDLNRYDLWNRHRAFAAMSKKDTKLEHCPAANCDFAWIVADPATRKKKIKHEKKPVFFFYKPPKPERVPFEWVEPDYMSMDHGSRSTPRDVHEPHLDGRRMACGKCSHVFCGLCRNPWMYESRRHEGTSCKAYRRQLPSSMTGSDLTSWEGTRACPRCRVRTYRIDGCNHMTCPCGYEWCYICECRWSRPHYACVERRESNACAIQ